MVERILLKWFVEKQRKNTEKEHTGMQKGMFLKKSNHFLGLKKRRHGLDRFSHCQLLNKFRLSRIYKLRAWIGRQSSCLKWQVSLIGDEETAAGCGLLLNDPCC